MDGDTAPSPPHSRRAYRRLRKAVEGLGAHLTERIALARLRVHDPWHIQHRLIRKVLAPTAVVFLNLLANQPPFDLGSLVSAS
jgi:hypothetical protein